MARITDLPALDPQLIDGTEQVPIVKDDATHRANLVDIPAPQAKLEADRAEVARQRAELAGDFIMDARNLKDSKAEAEADKAALADQAFVIVLGDETNGGARVIYRKENGELVQKDNLSQLAAYIGELISNGGTGTRYRAVLGDDINGNGKNDRADFTVFRERAAWAAGANGAPYAYVDQVAAIAMNLNSSFGRKNPDMPGTADVVEPRYHQGGQWALEWQRRFYTLDNVEKRPLQLFLPHHSTTRGVANFQMQVDLVRFHDWADVQRAQFDLQNGVLDLTPGLVFQFGGNNEPILRQMNGAGDAFLPLPFLDENDAIRQQQPHSILADVSKPNLFGNHAAFQAESSNHGPNSYQHRMTMTGTVAGEMFGYDYVGSATAYTQSVHNVKPGGKTVAYLTSVDGETAHVLGTDVQRWTAGVEPVSGEYRVCPENNALTGAQGLRISPDGKLKAQGGLGVGNAAAATTLGNIVGKTEVFDVEGNSLGFLPIYDGIAA